MINTMDIACTHHENPRLREAERFVESQPCVLCSLWYSFAWNCEIWRFKSRWLLLFIGGPGVSIEPPSFPHWSVNRCMFGKFVEFRPRTTTLCHLACLRIVYVDDISHLFLRSPIWGLDGTVPSSNSLQRNMWFVRRFCLVRKRGGCI